MSLQKTKRKHLVIKYRKAHIRILIETIPKAYLRPKICPSCHTPPNCWHFHHWLYAYATKKVKANKELIFDNGVWLCYKCHKFFADHWTWIVYWTRRFPRLGLGVMKLMPIEFKKTLVMYYVEMINE